MAKSAFYVHGLTFLLLLSAVIFRPVLDYIEGVHVSMKLKMS